MRGGVLLLTLFGWCVPGAAEVNRVVILKVDGLPEALVERYTAEGRLPRMQQIFGKGGAWLENFYVRGLSLSAPSWSLLDTGRHLEIRGNVEYDRYTLRAYDYLNFFPFYVGYAASRRVDMAGVELLDEHHIPLLIDRFAYAERFQGFQLLQRGVRWSTLESSLKRTFTSRNLKELFDEWQTGLSLSGSVNQQTEKELIEDLKDSRIRYLDYFTGDYDHVAHLTSDRVAQLHAIEELDALVGRVWAAILASPLAATTALVVVSDHGMNTSVGIYSQGFNLVDWFNSRAGGAQHVLTNRHPLTEFKLKGLDPFVSEVITPSAESRYLAGEGPQYPTVMLDLDGNERASIGLRNNTLNKLHVLLDQLIRKRLPGPARSAVLAAFFKVRGEVAEQWGRDVTELREQLAVLDTGIRGLQEAEGSQPRKWTSEQRARGVDKEARRKAYQLEAWKAEQSAYAAYAGAITRLLALEPSDFDPGKFKIDEVIPKKSLGPLNSGEDVRHYVTGPAAEGMVLGPEGALDLERSFRTVDYFAALTSLSVKNTVQAELGSRPVDFIAARILEDAILLWRSPDRQVQIQTRRNPAGELELRYSPAGGASWSAGLPLELLEDPQLSVPGDRREWLDQWHSEREWLQAVHRTHYSNGIISLAEQLLNLDSEPNSYLERKRRQRRTDLLVFASDHWNFNVRGFNPGGNHGSLLRVSTHSVLLFAGGRDTGIPRGVRIATPYDSLSFVPTILSLMGRGEPSLPGRVISELAPLHGGQAF